MAKNVEIKETDKQIVITIDKTKEFGDSKSGKTTIIASTEGNQPLSNGKMFVGVNVYKKK
jgi:ABC-type polar amino acid transport system ATPase subunit